MLCARSIRRLLFALGLLAALGPALAAAAPARAQRNNAFGAKDSLSVFLATNHAANAATPTVQRPADTPGVAIARLIALQRSLARIRAKHATARAASLAPRRKDSLSVFLRHNRTANGAVPR